MIRSAFVLAAVLFAAAPAFAQTATVSGFVRDAETGETLVQATVRVDGTNRGVATNTQGFYSLAGLPAGAVALRVSTVGYAAQTLPLTLAAGETRQVDVSLAPESFGEAVVVAQQTLSDERPPGVADVPIRLVQSLPTVFEADLFRSIQLLPGVKSANDFSSALYIRGGSPDQTLILLDGTTVYNPTHFFGFFSTFNTDAIKDVRLFKGAYPSEYGGRLGSVLDISSRDGNRNRTAGTATVGVLASRVGIEGPLPGLGGRGSYMVAARRSTLEPLLGFLRTTPDSTSIPDGFYFYDVNARVGVDLSPRDRISAAVYAGQDRVQLGFGEDSAFDLNYGNRTASLAYTRVLSGTVFTTARATASRYFSYPVGTIAETTFRRPNTITDYSGRLDTEWSPSAAVTVRGGVWGGTLDLGLRTEFNGSVATDYRNPSRYGSAYVQTRLRPGAGWSVTGGLRVETFRSVTDDLRTPDVPGTPASFTRLSPQLQVERSFGDRLVLQAAAGRYHQFLSLISNEAFSAFDTWVTTGVGVPPQAGDQLVLGAKTRLGAGYRLDVELYGRTMRDLFDLDPTRQDVSGLGYRDLFRFGQGYAAGAEFLLEKGTGRLTGLVSYTIGTTRRRYPDLVGFTDYFSPKYDRLHDVTAVASYSLGRGWKVTSAGTYATGQAYTAPTGRYEIDGLPTGDPSDGLYSPSLNNARLPAYNRVDVGFQRNGRIGPLRDTELQLQVVNVYSRRNVWFVTYDFEQNPVEQTRVTQLPRLPNVSLTVRF